MNRQDYLDSLVTLAATLDVQAQSEDLLRRRQTYLGQLVALAKDLAAQHGPVPASPANTEIFERVIMASPKDILWRVAGASVERRKALPSARRAMLGVLETRPDLLGPLGQAHVEVVHSALVAHFLDPRKSGDVGTACRAAFGTFLIHPTSEEEEGAIPEALNFVGAEVRTERHLGKHGRVDISIESPRAVVLIEVKVDAAEGLQQVPDYAAALGELCAQGAREGILVFLTQDPEQRPSVKQAARHIIFRDLLRLWLPVAISGRTSEHMYLSMYLKTVAVHLYGLAEADTFDYWSLRTQRNALRFLESEVEST
ncbi:PD-(D/E)XK nuclease family protein [Sorangium sp. So ce362]|uniref:PD-(D/E)XK nuclease family protein n=1 Tax=Sorangium sp. So ce362 TaxID=3133303 RepID=UPI003F6384AC